MARIMRKAEAVRTQRLPRVLLAAVLGLLLPAGLLNALEVPRLQGRVNDYAGMISANARGQLEDRLRSLEESDSTQLVILTIPSLEDEDLEGYSIRVAERIGKGNAEVPWLVRKGRESICRDLTCMDMQVRSNLQRDIFEDSLLQ